MYYFCTCVCHYYKVNTWGRNCRKGTTKVLCVHFGVRYLCTIYMYKHLYFSCGNVDIYDNVNIAAVEPEKTDF